MGTKTLDFSFANHGSVWLVNANNRKARKHLADNVQSDATWYGPKTLVVEPRYVGDLASGLLDAGFSVKVAA